VLPPAWPTHSRSSRLTLCWNVEVFEAMPRLVALVKRREFQNDALIALTARHHGATIVTRDRVDFELLARKLHPALVLL
jgi:predicted nucleic acid-binding protein